MQWREGVDAPNNCRSSNCRNPMTYDDDLSSRRDPDGVTTGTDTDPPVLYKFNALPTPDESLS